MTKPIPLYQKLATLASAVRTCQRNDNGEWSAKHAARIAVGDDYARDLAVEFFRALLSHAQPKNPAAALSLARILRDGDRPEQ